MRTGLIILESGARHEELCRLVRELAPQPLLVVRLEPGTPGVVSEYAEVETIRIGFPAASRHAFFQVLEPRAEKQTCASVALGRTTFGRGVRDVVCPERSLARALAHALAGHDVRCWLNAVPCRPEDVIHASGVFDAHEVVEALKRARSIDT